MIFQVLHHDCVQRGFHDLEVTVLLVALNRVLEQEKFVPTDGFLEAGDVVPSLLLRAAGGGGGSVRHRLLGFQHGSTHYDPLHARAINNSCLLLVCVKLKKENDMTR